MIELRNVSVRYGDVQPLSQVTLAFPSGISTAIMGPSGSGKSTLLRLMAGLQRADEGDVLLDGARVRNTSWRTASESRVALIHQDYRLVPFLSVEENLRLAAELRSLQCSSTEINTALAKVSLSASFACRAPNTLSGGEQQRVAIARALITGSPVLLGDEPTGALDSENTQRVTEILNSLARVDGLTVVVATHDSAVAEQMDRLVILDSGKVLDHS